VAWFFHAVFLHGVKIATLTKKSEMIHVHVFKVVGGGVHGRKRDVLLDRLRRTLSNPVLPRSMSRTISFSETLELRRALSVSKPLTNFIISLEFVLFEFSVRMNWSESRVIFKHFYIGFSLLRKNKLAHIISQSAVAAERPWELGDLAESSADRSERKNYLEI
jgi:hypothetical protein